MKKHDDGYVLAYVTVVLLIFCLVATVILTGALRNLQTQQNTIAQMKDQYAAEGMIEQVMAQLNKKGNVTIYGDSYKKTAEDGITVTAKMTVSIVDDILTLEAESGSVKVTSTIKLTAGNAISVNNVATITNLTEYCYDSHQIGTVEVTQ